MEPSRQVDQFAHSVIGEAIEVHRTLGPGYLESVYEGHSTSVGALLDQLQRSCPEGRHQASRMHETLRLVLAFFASWR